MAKRIVPNPIRRENGKVYLTLQRGLVAVVDEADYPLVSRYHWTAIRPVGIWYVKTTITHQGGKQDSVLMHRMIFGLTKGDGKQVDHKDHNGLNNARDNLRFATSSQNNRNRRLRVGISSRFRGVCRQKKYPPKPWQASIGVDGGRKWFLGYFLTEREAAEAYNVAAKTHHGEFANLNEFD